MPLHDVIEGFLGTFLYTYNLRAPPPGGERPLQIYAVANWAMRECADAEGQRAELLERALCIFKPLIWRIDRFIAAMPSEGGMLFRGLSGVRMARHYSVGKHVLLPSITSLSRSGDVAWGFTGSEGGTWISVQAVSAFDARWASFAADEEEFIFGSNTVLVVTDKPTDDERQVLSTTHDAVGLAQLGEAAGGTVSQLDGGATVRLRLQGMSEKRIIFRDFAKQYVEPSVARESEGAQQQQQQQEQQQQEQEQQQHYRQQQSLSQAFESFLQSEQQWLLLVAPQGSGKSSALLWLYYQQLRAVGQASTHWQGRVPVFVSLPLVSADALARSEPWLPAQLRRQLHLDEAGWRHLAAQGLLLFADSADEALLQSDLLKEGSLADRAGLPRGSRGVISVREEDTHRLMLTPRDVAGAGCHVLHLLPFTERERKDYVTKLVRRQCDELCGRLRGVPLRKETERVLLCKEHGEKRQQQWLPALKGLPGCVPQHVVGDLHSALHRACGGGSPLCPAYGVSELKARYQEEAFGLTWDCLTQILDAVHSEANTLVFTMAAEVADELSTLKTRDAVIETALLRRMRRASARVDPAAWDDAGARCAAGLPVRYGRSEAKRVDLLMRAAEALAAALTLSKQWSGQIGPVTEAAAALCEVRMAAPVFRALLPGLPLRTASAEDATSRFALLHRQVQEWLAAQWAARAAVRGRGKEVLEVVHALRYWAGAYSIAAAAAQRLAETSMVAARRAVAEGAERGPAMRPALQARIAALAQQGDAPQAARELQDVATECEELYGEDALTAEAFYWCGHAYFESWLRHEAVRPLRRALLLRRKVLEPGHPDTLITQILLARALVDANGMDEAEQLLSSAHAAAAAGSPEELRCIGNLASLHRQRGNLEQALRLYRQTLEPSERMYGPEHPSTLTAVGNVAWTLDHLDRWAEALPLWRREYVGRRRVMPRGHPYLTSAACCYADHLLRSGRAAERDEAEMVLRAEGLWEQWRSGQVASLRRNRLREYRRLGAADYATVLQEDAGTAALGASVVELLPEMVAERDEQLRRVAKGLEPFDDPEGNANALYRTGKCADREAAEALLRAAGLWEQRQARAAWHRDHLLHLYRQVGAAEYGALLRGEVQGKHNERRVCAWHYPELLGEVDEQLRRVGQGLEPFEDPVGRANALYRTGRSADREAAGALLRAAGLWEQRQQELAGARGTLLEAYRRRGAAAYALALREGDARRLVDSLPEMREDADEQLRRVGEGLAPFEDPEGMANDLYRTGQPADRDAAAALLRDAGLWEQRQRSVADHRRSLRGDYCEMGAAGYWALLRGDVDHEQSQLQWCRENLPEMVQEIDEQLQRVAGGLPPYPEEAECATVGGAERAAALPAAELGGQCALHPSAPTK